MRWLILAVVCAVALWAADEKPKAPVVPSDPEQRIAKGKELVDGICFWCHEPELMETKQLNREQWSDLIRPMIYEGAPVTKDEFDMIVEFLVKNFGPPEEEKK